MWLMTRVLASVLFPTSHVWKKPGDSHTENYSRDNLGRMCSVLKYFQCVPICWDITLTSGQWVESLPHFLPSCVLRNTGLMSNQCTAEWLCQGSQLSDGSSTCHLLTILSVIPGCKIYAADLQCALSSPHSYILCRSGCPFPRDLDPSGKGNFADL